MKKFERRRSLFLATFSLALPLSDRKVPNNNMRSVLQVKGDHLFKDEKPRPEAKKNEKFTYIDLINWDKL